MRHTEDDVSGSFNSEGAKRMRMRDSFFLEFFFFIGSPKEHLMKVMIPKNKIINKQKQNKINKTNKTQMYESNPAENMPKIKSGHDRRFKNSPTG